MNKILIFITFVIFASSCYSSKDLVYLQDGSYSEKIPKAINNKRPVYKIQPNDILSIEIKSPNPETSALFNDESSVRGAFQANPALLYLRGYSVDDMGNINIPLIGKLEVKDQSVDEIKRLVQAQVDKLLVNSSVEVKLVSFKISVLGQVNNPGYYYIYNGQATLLEGLALAGDITDYGSRTKIKLIRQTQSGSEVILLDLTDPGVIQSPYYYLLPNDVIYVQPSPRQVSRENTRTLGLIFGGISAAVLLANFILDVNK